MIFGSWCLRPLGPSGTPRSTVAPADRRPGRRRGRHRASAAHVAPPCGRRPATAGRCRASDSSQTMSIPAMCAAFQTGSSMRLASRVPSRFWTVVMARKWSTRNTACSGTTSASRRFSVTALPRSSPNGFSSTILLPGGQGRLVQRGDRRGEDRRGQRQVGGDRPVTGDGGRDAGRVGDIGPAVVRRRHDGVPPPRPGRTSVPGRRQCRATPTRSARHRSAPTACPPAPPPVACSAARPTAPAPADRAGPAGAREERRRARAHDDHAAGGRRDALPGSPATALPIVHARHARRSDTSY